MGQGGERGGAGVGEGKHMYKGMEGTSFLGMVRRNTVS